MVGANPLNFDEMARGELWLTEGVPDGPLPDDTLLTAKQAEDLLGVRPNTLKQWVYREHLAPLVRGVRPHRFRLADVEECMDARAASRVASEITGV